jgi:hypothetical protein
VVGVGVLFATTTTTNKMKGLGYDELCWGPVLLLSFSSLLLKLVSFAA